MQRNWIGRSTSLTVNFGLESGEDFPIYDAAGHRIRRNLYGDRAGHHFWNESKTRFVVVDGSNYDGVDLQNKKEG